uniref:Uncharacterized protein n=1 Tax=viral metagenome TaxID=1070528 RepID=A0A6M3L210_9ZZZZ
MVKSSLFLGYEIGTGKEVTVPIFHTLITGQTRLSGKSTNLKAMAKQAIKKGFKVLVMDTKINLADFEGFGNQIPVCLKQTTDPLVLRDLLESINQRKITQFQSTLIDITRHAKTFEEVIENAKDMLEKKRISGFKKDACTTLIDLLARLIEQTKKFKTTVNLELPYPINVMTVNDFDLQGQQLIANTVLAEVLTKFENVIIMLDEAFKLLPQKWGSPCKQRVQEYVTQGAATGCFLWLATQFLAPTSKDAMKAMPIKILGRQDHNTEVEHTLELIPESKGKYSDSMIMQLKLGHFIVVTPEGSTHTYVCPEFADRNECIEVAMEIRNPSDIHYVFSVDKKDFDKIRKNRPLEEAAEQVEYPLDFPVDLPPITKPDSTVFTMEVDDPEAEKLEPKPEEPIAININLDKIERRIKVRTIIRSLNISDDTIRGKILTIAHEGFFSEYRVLEEVTDELAKRGWSAQYRRVQNELARIARDGIFGVKKIKKGLFYTLAPNVIFEEEKVKNVSA